MIKDQFSKVIEKQPYVISKAPEDIPLIISRLVFQMGRCFTLLFEISISQHQSEQDIEEQNAQLEQHKKNQQKLQLEIEELQGDSAASKEKAAELNAQLEQAKIEGEKKEREQEYERRRLNDNLQDLKDQEFKARNEILNLKQ